MMHTARDTTINDNAMTQIAVSMLAADFLHLEAGVQLVNRNADLFHLDIMDGVFVPNISFGFPVVEAITSVASRTVDVHLMMVHPEKYVERFASAGADMLSFHLNAVESPEAMLDMIHGCGMKAGIAINPDIPVERLFPYLAGCDFLLVMSVFAGFGGQKFIEETYGRISALKTEIRRQGLECLIEVDGGVSDRNAGKLSLAGADILVAGSAVFNAPDPAAEIAAMRGR